METNRYLRSAQPSDAAALLAIAVIALPNEASVALHEGLGFTQVGIIHSVARKFDTWHGEGIWELDLGSP
jgi:L-amino acid N-acyltransferase YncA